jgi:hypothetical protein
MRARCSLAFAAVGVVRTTPSASVRRSRLVVPLLGALTLAACAVAPPTGPNVVALPGKDKTFEVFQADDAVCRQYASAQIGNASPAQAANQSLINSAVFGAVIGAILGAAIGAPSADAGIGAAIGGASGLAVGGLAGIDASQASSASLQRRYDVGYIQCMSAKGESVQTAAVYPVYSAYPAYYYPYYPYYYPYYSYYPYYPYYSSTFIGVSGSFHSHSDHHGGHPGGHPGGHAAHGGHH